MKEFVSLICDGGSRWTNIEAAGNELERETGSHQNAG